MDKIVANIRLLLLVLVSTFAMVCTCSAADVKDRDAIGVLRDSDVHTREFFITPKTKYVNATQGELVKFTSTATGRSFVWYFDTRSWASFDLSAVAPPGVLPEGQHIQAYVSEMVWDH